MSVEGFVVISHQCLVFLGLTPIQMHDGLQVAQLPLRPFVQGAVDHGVVVAGIDEQNLVADVGVLVAVEEPQRAWQGKGIKEVVAHAHHHIHIARADEFFADIAVFVRAVGGRASHHEARATMVVQVGIEIANPKVVGIAHFLGLGVHARQSERQTSRRRSRLGLHLVHIEGRIGHHIVALASEVMRIVVERVGLVARDNLAVQPVYRHVHQTELGVVFHLLLAEKGHLRVGVHAVLVHEVARLHKHAATTASGVEHHALLGFQHVHQHLHQRLGGEKHTIVAGHGTGKLGEEILIDTPDDVAAHLVDGLVVEDAEQLAQQVVRKHRVGLGQHTRQLLALVLHKLHGIVDSLTQ